MVQLGVQLQQARQKVRRVPVTRVCRHTRHPTLRRSAVAESPRFLRADSPAAVPCEVIAAMRPYRQGDTAVATDAAFDALADPVRRSILDLLSRHDSRTAGEIADAIDSVGRTAVSSHLRVLHTAGLVSERRDGRFRHYSLSTEGPMRDVIGLLQGLLQNSLDDADAVAPSRSSRGTRSA
ncbi:metalloregulator ArsR/SmtB family transcription factor [Nakamurella flava]|uniref:metalloregulator ArsR/SmtB family transcription factor n=1 Tax=Nakamurella flava TaxID=2576308 RepID=UPI00197CB266|nr:metalloregulator ArsR/SmtB family transcription factor [Nakamurella flava]